METNSTWKQLINFVDSRTSYETILEIFNQKSDYSWATEENQHNNVGYQNSLKMWKYKILY